MVDCLPEAPGCRVRGRNTRTRLRRSLIRGGRDRAGLLIYDQPFSPLSTFISLGWGEWGQSWYPSPNPTQAKKTDWNTYHGRVSLPKHFVFFYRIWFFRRVQKPRLRKMSVMGVPPLPPSRKAAGQKVNGKKITEKGGNPPHHGHFPLLRFLNTSLFTRHLLCLLLFSLST